MKWSFGWRLSGHGAMTCPEGQLMSLTFHEAVSGLSELFPRITKFVPDLECYKTSKWEIKTFLLLRSVESSICKPYSLADLLFWKLWLNWNHNQTPISVKNYIQKICLFIEISEIIKQHFNWIVNCEIHFLFLSQTKKVVFKAAIALYDNRNVI